MRRNGLEEYTEFRKFFVPTDNPRVLKMAGEDVYSQLLRGLFMGISAVTVRKSVFDRTGPFDESLKNSDDRAMWMSVARMGVSFAYLDRELFSYRKHGNSVTNRGHLRIPSLIRNFTNQLTHLEPSPDREFVVRKIYQLRLSYAYGLQSVGKWAEAKAEYQAAFGELRSAWALKGIVVCSIGLLFSRVFNRRITKADQDRK